MCAFRKSERTMMVPHIAHCSSSQNTIKSSNALAPEKSHTYRQVGPNVTTKSSM